MAMQTHSSGGGAGGGGQQPLEILHFNDVYEVEPRARDPVGGVARFIGTLKQYPDACVLFSGDSLAPSLMSTVTKGSHMVKFLNMMNIKAACMGNHDFDFGVDHLVDNCVKKCGFPWLLSNAYDKETGERLAQGEESLILEHGGWRIGVMGLIEEEWLLTLSTLERDEVDYIDYVQVARRLNAQLRSEGADIVIALTHMRNPNDQRLAREVPELDLILGGHDHEVYHEVINGVPIIKSGTDFRHLTRIVIARPSVDAVDGGGGGGVKGNITWEEMLVTSESKEDQEAHDLVEMYRKDLNRSMEKVLGDLGCGLDATFAHIRTRETNCSNWICDCVRDGMYSIGYEVDLVLLNAGTLRADDVFPPGPFLMRDLVTLLPMLDELCVLKMTGKQVHEALENSVSQYPKMEGRFPCISGFSFAFDPQCVPGRRVEMSSVSVRGVPIDPVGEYHVVTKAYLASGKDGYQVFQQCPMVSDSEGTPLLADLVRAQFTHLAEINRQSALPSHVPHSEESFHRTPSSRSHHTPSSSSHTKPTAGAARPCSVTLLRRSIHLGREEDSPRYSIGGGHLDDQSPSPTKGGTPATPASPGSQTSGSSFDIVRASTGDLEALLLGGPGNEGQGQGWASAKKAHPGDVETMCLPHMIGGRFQIFGKTDGRIRCLHPTPRKSMDGLGMP